MQSLKQLWAKLGTSRKWVAFVVFSGLAILGDQGLVSEETVEQLFYAFAAIVGVEGAADIVSRARGK